MTRVELPMDVPYFLVGTELGQELSTIKYKLEKRQPMVIPAVDVFNNIIACLVMDKQNKRQYWEAE